MIDKIYKWTIIFEIYKKMKRQTYNSLGMKGSNNYIFYKLIDIFVEDLRKLFWYMIFSR